MSIMKGLYSLMNVGVELAIARISGTTDHFKLGNNINWVAFEGLDQEGCHGGVARNIIVVEESGDRLEGGLGGFSVERDRVEAFDDIGVGDVGSLSGRKV
jgi:hypothetical protein